MVREIEERLYEHCLQALISGVKSLKKVNNEQKRSKMAEEIYFIQLLGARSTQKLVEIHNTPLPLKSILRFFCQGCFTQDCFSVCLSHFTHFCDQFYASTAAACNLLAPKGLCTLQPQPTLQINEPVPQVVETDCKSVLFII